MTPRPSRAKAQSTRVTKRALKTDSKTAPKATPKTATKKAPKKTTRKPLQVATVFRTPPIPESMSTTVDKGILQKIQEARTRASDPDTPESEAKAALAESEELIKQHNVLPRDLEVDENETFPIDLHGSIVRIQKVGPPEQRVRQDAFLHPLARAVDNMFYIRCISRHGYYRWDACFDGAPEYTMAAAMTFKTAHNQILEWGCAQKGGAPDLSYRLGVVHGLEKMSRPQKPKKSHKARPKIPISLETGVPELAGSDVEEADFRSEEEYDSDRSGIRSPVPEGVKDEDAFRQGVADAAKVKLCRAVEP